MSVGGRYGVFLDHTGVPNAPGVSSSSPQTSAAAPSPQTYEGPGYKIVQAPGNSTAATVFLDPDWQVKLTPVTKNNEVSVVKASHVSEGKDIQFIACYDKQEKEWTCTGTENVNGKKVPWKYKQSDGAPPSNVAPYIQKAFQAYTCIQQVNLERQQIDGMKVVPNINMEGLDKLEALKIEADKVIERGPDTQSKLTATPQNTDKQAQIMAARRTQSLQSPMMPVRPSPFSGGPSPSSSAEPLPV
jgi:hypothetical protein